MPDVHGDWAKSLAMEGLSDTQIAERMGIARSTYYKWKGEYEEFSDAIKMGKEPADAKVKQSLFKRAIGYTFKEKKIIVEMDAKGNQKPSKIETYERVMPPDVGAIAFWLKNRDPKAWADRQELTGAKGKPLIPEVQMTDEERDERIAILKAKLNADEE